MYAIRNFPNTAHLWNVETFSVGIGEVVDKGRQPAAIYRVRGRVNDLESVRRLAGRLCSWLNNPKRPADERSPCEIPSSNDWIPKIVLTKAGKAQGWLPAGRFS